jgi:hypothetical protein
MVILLTCHRTSAEEPDSVSKKSRPSNKDNTASTTKSTSKKRKRSEGTLAEMEQDWDAVF